MQFRLYFKVITEKNHLLVEWLADLAEECIVVSLVEDWIATLFWIIKIATTILALVFAL